MPHPQDYDAWNARADEIRRLAAIARAKAVLDSNKNGHKK
jgi:hypothetical protein